MIKTILDISLLVLAVLLVIVILLQARGASAGAIFGGEGNVYRTKRGVEKKLFQVTIIIAILFFLVALAGSLF